MTRLTPMEVYRRQVVAAARAARRAYDAAWSAEKAARALQEAAGAVQFQNEPLQVLAREEAKRVYDRALAVSRESYTASSRLLEVAVLLGREDEVIRG